MEGGGSTGTVGRGQAIEKTNPARKQDNAYQARETEEKVKPGQKKKPEESRTRRADRRSNARKEMRWV